MDTHDLVLRRDSLLGPGTPLFYSEPIHIVRGDGVYLFGADGKRYVDMYNNVPCVGHANPRVVAAMKRQAETLNVHSRYLHEGILDYAERLLDKHAAHLQRAVFTCTGTEANEVAISIARIGTGNRGVICTDAAYHGNSAEVGKLTRAGAQQRPEIQTIPFPQLFRPIVEGASEGELCQMYLSRLDDAIAKLDNDGSGVAALLVCPILANEGLPDIPSDFMSAAAQRVRAAGGLFIADEVQSGFGRTGQWWGYQTMDVEPDIVALGKPMGNGLPLAGVVARDVLIDSFRAKSRYFNTFASSPLQAAVGMSVLEEIESRDLVASVADVGRYLKHALQQMTHDQIAEIRGHGLFVGVEWVKSGSKDPDREGAVKIVDALKDKGFLIGNAGVFGNVLKIRPPLVFQREHADLFLTAFDQTLRETA